MGAVENIITDNLPLWSSSVQLKSTRGRGSSSKRNLYGIKKLRELILDLAVRGLLVPQDPNDEPASVLLENILAEKKLRGSSKKGRTKNINSKVLDDIDIGHTPDGWIDTSISEIAEIQPKNEHPILTSIDFEKGYYFLHSYYFECHDEKDILATTHYGDVFHCAVNKGNIFGFQFHPEKSHFNGINLFKNFAEL